MSIQEIEDEDQLRSIEKFQKAVKISALISQKPTHDQIMQRAQKALMKPLATRTGDDFSSIERLMIRVKFFTKLKLKHGLLVFKEVCKYLYYKRVQPNVKIISINKEGQTFYVILKGSVGVNIYLPKTKKAEASPLSSDIFEEQEINTLSTGDSFGELSLLDPESRTTATILSKDTTELACLDKEQFQQILGAINQAEMNDKMEFVRSIHFLLGWFENDLKTLSFHFECEFYDMKEFVFKEGDECNGFVYFLKKGEVKLSKYVNSKQVDVCRLVEGEMFGEDEYMNLEQREYTAVITIENTQLYRLAKDDLDRRIWHVDAREIFMENLEVRWQWRKNRAQYLKPAAIQIEEDLRQYLNPDIRESKSFSSQKKISSFQKTQPFNFMEPTTTLQYLSAENNYPFAQKRRNLKTKSTISKLYVTQTEIPNNQMGSTKKEKDTFHKFRKVSSQTMKNCMINKFEQDEILEKKILPFNFVTQESVKHDEKRKSFASMAGSHKTLIDEVNEYANSIKPKILSRGMSRNASINLQNSLSKSIKSSEILKSMTQYNSKSPVKLQQQYFQQQQQKQQQQKGSYLLDETKTTLRFKRFFQFQ